MKVVKHLYKIIVVVKLSNEALCSEPSGALGSHSHLSAPGSNLVTTLYTYLASLDSVFEQMETSFDT